MKTIIVSAFPACGKSYATKYLNSIGYKTLDSDSCEFSWLKDELGNNTTIRNPNFIREYINHIKENIGKVDFIFVSSHKDVRIGLENNELNYTIVYPDKIMKNEWVGRCFNRGNTFEFCSLISKNFNIWIDEIKQEIFNTKFITGEIVLNNNNSYIMSVIDIISTHTGNYK